jgi:ATP-dependent Clp protease ATP-binding subunit ClpC
MTSNVGASSIKRQTTLGFGAMTADDADHDGMKEKILEESKRYFKPEFLNRLDGLVVFHMLEKKDLNQIVDLEVAKLVKRLKEKEIFLTLTDEARDLLAIKGFDPAYGARPMRRAVERFLEDPLAEALLRGDVKPKDSVNVVKKAEGEELDFVSTRPEPEPEVSAAGV